MSNRISMLLDTYTLVVPLEQHENNPMTRDDKYDALFDETAPDDSVFSDKSALDPLAEPDEIVARDAQEQQLARLLNGIHESYLPTTVSVYGPPEMGKVLTTRRVCHEFAACHDELAVEY